MLAREYMRKGKEPWATLLGGLNMAEECDMTKEPNVYIEQSFITMEEPTLGMKEKNKFLFGQFDKQNDKVR